MKKHEAVDLRNVQIVHPEALKPCPQVTTLPSDLTSRFVKIPFSVRNCQSAREEPTLNWQDEYMWVKVTHDNGDMLVGTLSNDPILCAHVANGDLVTFRREKIVSYK